MPYSIMVSQIRIYPGITQFHFTINVKTRTRYRMNYQLQTNGMDMISMSTRTLVCKLSMPNQWTRSCQLLMSTRTLAAKLSMPN